MSKVVIVEPNNARRIAKFAETLGISIEKAKFIEHMRAHYIAWEYDYVKTSDKVTTKVM